MAQLTGSGAGHGTNYAMVDDINRLWTNTILNSVKVRGSGLVVFPKEHDREIMGQAFLCGSSFYKIPSNGSVGILLVIGSCDLHAQSSITADGDANFMFMENVQVTNSGVQNPIINRNRNSTDTVNTTVWTNPIVTDSGTIIHTALMLGGSGTGTKFVSPPIGVGIHGEQLILRNGSSYWIKIENLAYRDISYDWNINMHEHC